MTFDPDWKERSPDLMVDLMVELKNFNSQWGLNRTIVKPATVIPETRVVNMSHDSYDVYIGREGKGQDGYFGNKHPVSPRRCPFCLTVHTRAEAIAEFKKDFYRRIMCDREYLKRVVNLRGYILGCFCVPARCHGEVIKEWLDKLPSPV